MGYKVKATFSIGLHERDLPLFPPRPTDAGSQSEELIKNYFGVGGISKQGKNSVQYRVSNIKELELICSHFDKYPLLTKKYSDFLLFKQAIYLIKQGEHLNMEGLFGCTW